MWQFETEASRRITTGNYVRDYSSKVCGSLTWYVILLLFVKTSRRCRFQYIQEITNQLPAKIKMFTRDSNTVVFYIQHGSEVDIYYRPSVRTRIIWIFYKYNLIRNQCDGIIQREKKKKNDGKNNTEFIYLTFCIRTIARYQNQTHFPKQFCYSPADKLSTDTVPVFILNIS